MRIGIFTECYHPTLNGVVVSIETFRKELEKRGHEYFIFAPGYKNFQDKNPAHVFRYPSIHWFQKDYPIALPIFALHKTSRIRSLNLDIIHTQHLLSMGGIGLKIGKRLDIPVIHTYHTLLTEYTHYAPIFKNTLKRTMVRLSRNYCNRCNRVITPSSPMKKLLRNYGVKVPVEVIPTGVSIEDFQNPFSRDMLETKWQIPKEKKLLLYVSRIAKEKNLDFLFQAIEILSKKRNDFHLLLVGGGPELDYYKKEIKTKRLSPIVTFTGRMEKNDTNRFYGAGDIFVFPSTSETQGIVITEAMAAGIPAIAINIMGPSDLIQNGVDGYLVPLNTQDFSDKIEKLLFDEKRRENMGRQAKINAEKFSIENCGLKMEKLYEDTIAHYP